MQGYNAAPARKKLLSAVVVGDDEVPRSEQPPEHHHQVSLSEDFMQGGFLSALKLD